jgi:hypothetical protein
MGRRGERRTEREENTSRENGPILSKMDFRCGISAKLKRCKMEKRRMGQKDWWNEKKKKGGLGEEGK